ncbi:MAG: protein translocase subunit SecF, partial [Luminiphilus sp.]|nr:protein translocase subunit SecF [Luminiphilus sp.]
MRWRWVAVGFSAAALLTAIISLAINQLNWGLDFTG